MQPTWWNDFVHMVHDLVGAMGPTPFTVLIVVLLILGLGGVFGFGYMVLHFGDKAAEMFFPFVKDCFAALAKESTKEHPAIKIERRFHYTFLLTLLLCLLSNVAHALIPWVNEAVERILFDVIVTSLVIIVLLAVVSITLSKSLD